MTMAQRKFLVEFEFSSTSAYGDPYTRRAVVPAENEASAVKVARLVGFSEFGARFTDNCFDWRIVGEAA